MEREHLFCGGFVLGQEMRVWPAAGVWNSKQVHVSSDVHLFGVIACKGFGEIEHKIGSALRERRQALRCSIQHLIERLVPKFLQSLEDFFAIFLFPFLLASRLFLLFRGELLFELLDKFGALYQGIAAAAVFQSN